LMIMVPWSVVGIAFTIALLSFVCWINRIISRNRSPRSLLPTLAQQAGDGSDTRNDTPSITQDHAGDGSDIRNAPDSNTPSFTQDHGRGENVVLQQPPPAVTRYNRASDLGPLVTNPASPTLLPMFMDGKDR